MEVDPRSFVRFYFYLYEWVWVCVCVSTCHVCAGGCRVLESGRLPGPGVTGGFESLGVGSGN